MIYIIRLSQGQAMFNGFRTAVVADLFGITPNVSAAACFGLFNRALFSFMLESSSLVPASNWKLTNDVTNGDFKVEVMDTMGGEVAITALRVASLLTGWYVTNKLFGAEVLTLREAGFLEIFRACEYFLGDIP